MEDNLSDKIKEGLPKLYPEQFIFAKDVKEAVKKLIKIGLKNGAIYYNDIENVFGGALV